MQTNCRRPTRYDLNQRMLQPPIPCRMGLASTLSPRSSTPSSVCNGLKSQRVGVTTGTTLCTSTKQTKLFAAYTSRSSTPSSSSSLQQIQKYLDMQDIEENTLQFWDRSQTSLDKLYLPALRALSVPCSLQCRSREGVQPGWDRYAAT